jgi:hypothetical protein
MVIDTELSREDRGSIPTTAIGGDGNHFIPKLILEPD